MVKSKAFREQIRDMGQTSSQLQDQPAQDPAMRRPVGSKSKTPKSGKGKRKSVETERPIDQEEDTARALLQMRETTIHNSAPYYDDEVAASAQLFAESSPLRSPRSLPDTDPNTTGRRRSRKDDRKAKQNRGQEKLSAAPSGEEIWSSDPLFSALRQTVHRTSPDRHPSTSQASHALDDIPTDDEEVAPLLQEYEEDTLLAIDDTSAMPNYDIHSFSQLSQDATDYEISQPTRNIPDQLPTQIFHSPNDRGQPTKRRKRRTTSVPDQAHDEQLQSEEGQVALTRDAEGLGIPYWSDMALANSGDPYEDHSMPIDPMLHSINALSPLADFSNVNDGGGHGMPDGQKNNCHNSGSSKPRKRRRVEGLPVVDSYISPYGSHQDLGKEQDQVLPGLEDLQQETPPELSPPLKENFGMVNLNFSDNERQSLRPSSQNRRWDLTEVDANPKENKQQQGQNSYRFQKENSEKGGAFTAEEGSKLDAFRDDYCQSNNLPISQFNRLIQSAIRYNGQTAALFNEIHDILPYRPRISVQRFCRRRFHNFSARGTWTQEEDEELRMAVAEKGKAWKAIGEMIERMPEDCRDRYRNYLVNSEHRNTEQWTESEVKNLAAAIMDCMRLMKDERRRTTENPDRKNSGVLNDSQHVVEDEKLVNWQMVSDRMGTYGGGRSRLQCSLKWSQIKGRDRKDILQAISEAQNGGSKKPAQKNKGWRMKRASKKVANMKPGDLFTFLQAILNCGAPVEGNIPWKSLGDERFRATWTGTDKKAAWSKMKQGVNGYDCRKYRDLASYMISRTLAQHADEIDHRWDPELHGDINETELKRRKKRRGEKEEKSSDRGKQREEKKDKNTRKSSKNAKSKEIVDSSGDKTTGEVRKDIFESHDVASHEPQKPNYFCTIANLSGVREISHPSRDHASSIVDERVGPLGWENDRHFNQAERSLHQTQNEEAAEQRREHWNVSPELAGRVQLLSGY